MKAAREAWFAAQPDLDPDKLVFLDETWASTKMFRTHGRCERGKRLVCDVPCGHWKTTTFLAALRVDGIAAPSVIDGPINGDLFVAGVRQQLVPTLQPGRTVILDNLSSHKRAEVRQAVEAAGCRLVYLPPYSPELNPIELVFSRLKRMLRSRGERTVEGLWKFLGEATDAFAPDECRNYFRHCGYGPTATRNLEPH